MKYATIFFTGPPVGAVQRPNDELVHLGPPAEYDIPYNSKLFETRCHLTAKDGPWHHIVSMGWRWTFEIKYCVECVSQAGIRFHTHDTEDELD